MKISKISNPLTIIGVFATIAEVATVTSLKNLPSEILNTYIWFIMLFPVLLVLLFFITLNFNPRVLYAPSDFEDENNFINLITKEKIQQAIEQVEKIEEELSTTTNDDKNIEQSKKELIEKYKKTEVLHVKKLLSISQLSDNQKEIVISISEGIDTNSKLATKFDVSRQRMVVVLKKLVERGYIQRDESSNKYIVHDIVQRALFE